MSSRKRPAKKPRKKAVAHKIGWFIRSKRVLIAKKKGGKRIDHKGSRLRKGLRVYKRKEQAQRALKRKNSKKKSRKCKHGVTKSGKCRQKYGGNKGNLSRSRRNYYIRKTSIGNVLYRNTQSKKASRKRRSGITVKQKRAACKRQGLVYDTKTKRCRKRKSGKRKSGKRKSGKRKSGKRKSGKKKSKFRLHSGKKHSGKKHSGRKHSGKKHSGRKHSGKKHSGRKHHRKHIRNANTDYTKLFITPHAPTHGHRRKSWASQTAMTSAARRQLAKKNKKCFLGKGMKYPICTTRGEPSCHGLIAAKSRSALVDHTNSRYINSKSRRMAKSVHKRASRLAKKHGCHHISNHFRGKL
jgi:hypothetical protein